MTWKIAYEIAVWKVSVAFVNNSTKTDRGKFLSIIWSFQSEQNRLVHGIVIVDETWILNYLKQQRLPWGWLFRSKTGEVRRIGKKGYISYLRWNSYSCILCAKWYFGDRELIYRRKKYFSIKIMHTFMKMFRRWMNWMNSSTNCLYINRFHIIELQSTTILSGTWNNSFIFHGMK